MAAAAAAELAEVVVTSVDCLLSAAMATQVAIAVTGQVAAAAAAAVAAVVAVKALR